MNDQMSLGAHLLDDSQPTPLYHQIYTLLRDRIRRGELAEGSLLPGEQELARLFAVSRITAKRALNELAEDDLVTRHRGRGTVVAGGMRLPVVKASFETLIDSLKVMGYETTTSLVDLTEVIAGDEVAGHLAIPVGQKVQRIVRLRWLQGEPFSYLVNYVPLPVAALFDRAALEDQAMLKIYDQAGIMIADAEQWISAVAAEAPVASALGIPMGSPLLRIVRLMRDKKGRAVQLIQGHYHPDRFEYHLRTHRRKGAWRSGD